MNRGLTKRRRQAGGQTRRHENGARPGGGAPWGYGAGSAICGDKGSVTEEFFDDVVEIILVRSFGGLLFGLEINVFVTA